MLCSIGLLGTDWQEKNNKEKRSIQKQIRGALLTLENKEKQALVRAKTVRNRET
jgi:hypothetical protein